MTSEVKIKSKTRTGLFIGITIGVLVVSAIGYAIFNFAIAPEGGEISRNFVTSFDPISTDRNKIVSELNSYAKHVGNGGFLDMQSNEKTFSNDLNAVNYLCSEDIKNRLAGKLITIEAIDGGKIDSTWLNSDMEKLKKFIKVKINAQDIESFLSSDVINKSMSTVLKWDDLTRWSVNKVGDPNKILNLTALVFADGSVLPIYKGKTKVQMGICNQLSNEIEIEVDNNKTELESFNIISTAGIGETKDFFVGNSKYNAAIVTSNNYMSTESAYYIKKIEGTLSAPDKYSASVPIGTIDYKMPSIDVNAIRILFSFDEGKTWKVTSLKNSVDNPNVRIFDHKNFADLSNAGDLKNVRWMIMYQYTNRLESRRQVSLSTDLNIDQIYGLNNQKLLFLRPIVPISMPSMYDNQQLVYENKTNSNLVQINQQQYSANVNIWGKNSGVTNFQMVSNNNNVADKNAMVVSLPNDLLLNEIKFAVTTAPISELGEAKIEQPEETTVNATITATPVKCDSVPCEVQFGIKEGNINGAYYRWVFGDQEGSTVYTNERSPKHNYTVPGVYNAKLVWVGDIPMNTNVIQIVVAEKIDEGEDVGQQVDPGPQNLGKIEIDTNQVQSTVNISAIPTNIFRGHDRVIVKIMPRDDNSKKGIEDAFVAKTLKFQYGKDKNNLDKEVEVKYDDKANQYYVVLTKLNGGKKQDYNKEGFENGKMKYYYRFMIGDQNLYFDDAKTINLASFRTLNRMQTIAYYYNWIFDKDYNFDKNYNWDKEQNGGLKFWYDTNLSLPGIRFAMINDRKFKVFDSILVKKKINNNLIDWLYKKILDRIYDDNLYKFAGEGSDFWLRQMTEVSETDRLDKTGVKFGISVSDEYRDQLAQSAESEKEAQAEFAYIVVLKRAGDNDGIKYLVDTFDSQLEMRENLFNSFEYNKRLEDIEKNSGRKGAIVELYETIYVRPADKAGVDYWDQSGFSVKDIKAEFLASDEFRNSLQ